MSSRLIFCPILPLVTKKCTELHTIVTYGNYPYWALNFDYMDFMKKYVDTDIKGGLQIQIRTGIDTDM